MPVVKKGGIFGKFYFRVKKEEKTTYG